MHSRKWIATLFYFGFLYDAVLGLGFLLFQNSVFEWFNVPPPNHPGYVQFPAALLITFSLLYLAVARNPVANRNLIPYGMLLKVSYCSVVFWHWFTAGLPGMWKPWAIFDLVFLALFWWAYRALGKLGSDSN
jgi:hypothetical protein